MILWAVVLLSSGNAARCLNKDMCVYWIVCTYSWVLSSSSKEFETLLSSLSELDATCSLCGGFYRIVQLLFFLSSKTQRTILSLKLNSIWIFLFPSRTHYYLSRSHLWVLLYVLFGYKATIVLYDDGRTCCKVWKAACFSSWGNVDFLGFFLFFLEKGEAEE